MKVAEEIFKKFAENYAGELDDVCMSRESFLKAYDYIIKTASKSEVKNGSPSYNNAWTFADGKPIPSIPFPERQSAIEFIDEVLIKLKGHRRENLTAILPISDSHLFNGAEYRGVKLEFDEKCPFDKKYVVFK